jgi:hypothetical protein
MRSFSSVVVSFAIALVFSSQAWGQDTLVFDTYAPPVDFGGFSSANGGEGDLLSVTQSLTISRIAILNEMLSPGSLEFVILSYPQPQFLYISAPQLFAMDPSDQTTWKESAPLDFSLEAGSEYLVGYLRNVDTDDYVYTEAVSESGITSDLSVATFEGFSTPTYSHIFLTGADAPIRLYAAVPEPGGNMILLALAPILFIRRRLRPKPQGRPFEVLS